MIQFSSPRRALAPVLAAAVSLLAASCGGPAEDARGANHPLIGKPAPELGAETVTGDGPKSLQAAQGKVVILDFWGTFCEPCKKSFPKYQEIVDQFPGDVTVLAVAVDDPELVKQEQVVQFAKDHQAKFAIVWDKSHKAAEAYGLRKLTVPSAFILDKHGVVRHLHVGFKPGEEAQVLDEVKALMAGK